MALQVSQTVGTAALVTPTALTPSASETIAEGSFGPAGVQMRVITTGTLTTISVQDPNTTAQGNPGTVTGLSTPASGSRMLLIPRAAINGSTGVATVLFSGALTGVTYELYRV